MPTLPLFTFFLRWCEATAGIVQPVVYRDDFARDRFGIVCIVLADQFNGGRLSGRVVCNGFRYERYQIDGGRHRGNTEGA